MKKSCGLFIITILLSIASKSQSAAVVEDKIEPKVRQLIQSQANVPVMVRLNVPIKREIHTRDEEQSQVRAIRAVQDQVLQQLFGTQYKLRYRFDLVPVISMEVGLAALAVLERSARVQKIYEIVQLRASLNQSVPYIGANQAWSSGFDGTGWYVAVLDSGIDKEHNHLKIQNTSIVDHEVCFSIAGHCPNGQSVMVGPGSAVHCAFPGARTACGHGTLMAGIVGSRDSTYKGVAPGARLMSIRLATHDTNPTTCTTPAPGDTTCVTFGADEILAGLAYVWGMSWGLPIAAVNMSLNNVSYYPDQQACDTYRFDIKTYIDYLRQRKIATVVSTGNDTATPQTNGIAWPGCISSAVSVGATNNLNQIWAGSVSAPYQSLLAPGVAITSSFPGNITANGSGTSNAAAHVSGAWAVLKQKKPTASVGQILNALQSTGVKITDTRSGANNRVHCRIQIDQALNKIPDPFVTLPITRGIAYGINNCGQIVGEEQVGWSGFLTDTAAITSTSIVYPGPLEPEGWYDSTEATAINNQGVIHGNYCCGYWGDRGIVRPLVGTIVTVDTPNTNNIYGSNDSGDLVGIHWVGPPGQAANFKYVNGVTTILTDLAPPLDINNMKRIVGEGPFDLGYPGVIMDENGAITHVYPPGATATMLSGINESGHIVGCYKDSSAAWHAFLRYPDGTLQNINVPASATSSCALGINDSNQIVGYYLGTAWGSYSAFVDLAR